MRTFINYLQSRDILESVSQGAESLESPIRCYLGFDPTAPSLHIGHLIGILFLKKLQSLGHQPFALVGGFTGMIGDPSGKNCERILLDQEEIIRNTEAIKLSLSKFLPGIKIFNNADWLTQFSLLEFFRDVGKNFRLGTMLSKDSVQKRITSEDGISYTEFCYQIFQAYDFYYLYENFGINLQCGGSDQWGNITAGIDFIRRKSGSAYGLTYPLLKDSKGKKIGKSESGETIWLDSTRTSAYQMFQYFLRLPDHDMRLITRLLTLLENDDILELDEKLKIDPIEAKKDIAKEIVTFVHGEQGVKDAESVTLTINPGGMTTLSEDDFDNLVSLGFVQDILRDKCLEKRLLDILVEIGFCASKSEGRRLIQQKGLYLNNTPLEDEHKILENRDIIAERYCLIAQGKKKKIVLRLI